jgi:integrase
MKHLIADTQGQPLKHGLTDLIERAARLAGLPTGPEVARRDRCTAHGLRKAALRRLAEAGCSTKQLQAISGHRSLEVLEVYVRDADQAGLAESAIAKLPDRTG